MNSLLSFDSALFRLVNLNQWPPWLDEVMLFISAKAPWLTVGGAFLLFVLWQRKRQLYGMLLLLIASISMADLVTYQLLKPGFQRLRPCYQEPDVRLLTPSCGSDYGFPSNHAANSAAIATIVTLSSRKLLLSGVAIVAALLVGFSRTYLGVHYPLDIVSGYVVGAMLSLLLWLLRYVWLKRAAVTGHKQ